MFRRYYLPWILVFGLTMGFLGHFATIVIFGDVVIREPRPMILWIEISCLLLIISYSVFRIADAISKEIRNKRN